MHMSVVLGLLLTFGRCLIFDTFLALIFGGGTLLKELQLLFLRRFIPASVYSADKIY